jgi:aminotransferase
MTARVDAVGGINLGQGLCRVAPPAQLLELAATTIAHRSHSYSSAAGTEAFREAVAAKSERSNGIPMDPDTQVVATIGATGAFTATLAGLLAHGDGVVLLEPFYGYHLAAVRLFGLRPEIARPGDDGRICRNGLLGAISQHTRAIVLCTPSNPSGHRLDARELAVVEEVARAFDLIVITDEIYEHIYYDAIPHLAPAGFGSLGNRTISISGLSKTFSVPGWRLGYATGRPELIERVRLAADVLVVCASTPLQDIAAQFLGLPETFYAGLREMYAAKLALVTDVFESFGCSVRRPQGSYYALVDLSHHGARTGVEAADILLERCGVGTVPLDAFTLAGSGTPLVRVCFSVPDTELLDIGERLRNL